MTRAPRPEPSDYAAWFFIAAVLAGVAFSGFIVAIIEQHRWWALGFIAFAAVFGTAAVRQIRKGETHA